MALALGNHSTANGFLVTSITTTLPSGHTSGDVLLLGVSSSDSVDPSSFPYTQVSGSPANDGNFGFCHGSLGRKIDGGSESDPAISYSANNKPRTGMLAISGADGTTPILTSGLVQGGDFATGLTPTSLSASGATVFSVLVLMHENIGGTITWPSGWVEQFHNESGGGGDDGIAMAVNTSPGTGTIAPGTVSLSNGRERLMWHLLVQQASGGGGGTRGLFRAPAVTGIGGGGSFFRDPLQREAR